MENINGKLLGGLWLRYCILGAFPKVLVTIGSSSSQQVGC